MTEISVIGGESVNITWLQWIIGSVSVFLSVCLDNDTMFKLYEPASVKQIIGCHFRIQNDSQAIEVYTHITSDKDIIYLFIVKYTNTTIVVG